VTGQNDAVQDGNQPYELRVLSVSSDDENYDGRAVAPVSLSNVDDDAAGIIVAAIDTLSHEDGSTARVSYVLSSEPTSDVVITVDSSDASEGAAAPVTLTFTPVNWASPQDVFVAGKNDAVQDGDQPYELRVIAVSSDDENYDGMTVAAGEPEQRRRRLGGHHGERHRHGFARRRIDGARQLRAELGAHPRRVITVQSSDASEGAAAPTTLTFTAANWASPQDVYVTGQNDAVQDGDQPYELRVIAVSSGDQNYAGRVVAPVSLSNVDDDSAGITVVTIDPASHEDGSTARVTYVLNSEPTGDVVITVASSDATEGVAAPTTLTFTALNWAAPQDVYVSGQNDAVQDGDQPYELRVISVASADANYDGLTVAPASLSNVDNDSAGIIVSSTDLQSSEAGDTATVSYVLTSEPTADVVISLGSANAAEGIASVSTLTFTPVNWAHAAAGERGGSKRRACRRQRALRAPRRQRGQRRPELRRDGRGTGRADQPGQRHRRHRGERHQRSHHRGRRLSDLQHRAAVAAVRERHGELLLQQDRRGHDQRHLAHLHRRQLERRADCHRDGRE
jgi:type IV pilus biogenesis protein CpaD/CtpE